MLLKGLTSVNQKTPSKALTAAVIFDDSMGHIDLALAAKKINDCKWILRLQPVSDSYTDECQGAFGLASFGMRLTERYPR